MTKLKRSHEKLSETSHGIKRFREVHSYLVEAAGIAERHSAQPYQLRRYTELRHSGKNTIPYGAIKGSLIVDKKMVCVDLFFVGLFQDLA